MDEEILLKDALADLKVATRTMCMRMRSLTGVVRERCDPAEEHAAPAEGEAPRARRCCGKQCRSHSQATE